jgi:hypothetical protein
VDQVGILNRVKNWCMLLQGGNEFINAHTMCFSLFVYAKLVEIVIMVPMCWSLQVHANLCASSRW